MVWLLVCCGFQAAREPSAKSMRNEIDDPPWFSLNRLMGWVRTRSSSSSSDMPRNVPDDSSATGRPASSDRSSWAASGSSGRRPCGATACRNFSTANVAPVTPPANSAAAMVSSAAT